MDQKLGKFRKSMRVFFLVFKRKILGRVFGFVKVNINYNIYINDSRIRKNEELEVLYQKPNIIEAIRNKNL